MKTFDLDVVWWRGSSRVGGRRTRERDERTFGTVSRPGNNFALFPSLLGSIEECFELPVFLWSMRHFNLKTCSHSLDSFNELELSLFLGGFYDLPVARAVCFSSSVLRHRRALSGRGDDYQARTAQRTDYYSHLPRCGPVSLGATRTRGGSSYLCMRLSVIESSHTHTRERACILMIK